MKWSMSAFFLGEERVTTELLPFAIATPDYSARAFLATQISDEAKHSVFFDRFYREVFGVDALTLAQNVEAQRPTMNKDYIELFDGILHECAETAAQGPVGLRRRLSAGSRLHDRDRGHAGPHRRAIHDPHDEGAGLAARASARDSRPSTATSRATSASASSSWPTRSRRTREQAGDPGHADRHPAGRDARARAADGRRPVQLHDPVRLHVGEMFEYAMKSLSKKLAAMGMEPIGAAA